MDWDDFNNDFGGSDMSNSEEDSYISFDADDFDFDDIDEIDEQVEEEVTKEEITSHKRLGRVFDSEESDDRAQRGTRTSRQKMMEAFMNCVARIGRCLTAGVDGDWLALREEFNQLEKEKDKAKAYIEMNGFPGIYLNGFTSVFDAAMEIQENKERKRSMRKDNARELTKIIQLLKATIKTDEELRESIEEYRLNPTAFEDENDDDDFNFLDMSSVDEAADDDYFSKDLSYWYEYSEEDTGSKRERRTGPGKKKDAGDVEEDRIVWTPDRVDKKLKELIQHRGSKQYRKMETILMLEFLYRKKKGLVQRLQVAFHLINAIFDSSSSGILSFKLWKYVFSMVTQIINTLFEHDDIIVLANQDTEAPIGHKKRVVYGSLIAILSKLDEELYKALQTTEANTKKYDERYNYIMYLVLLSKYVENYQKEKGNQHVLSAFIQLKHLYYLNELVVVDADEDTEVIPANSPDDNPDDDTPEGEIISREFPSIEPQKPMVEFYGNLDEALHFLTSYLYQHSEMQTKTITVLYHVYHLALHSKYYQARDLLMMTHIPDKIHEVDVSVQALYNRCMAQLGIAAFKELRMSDVHACINDLLIGGRCKELIAQGISHRQQEKTPEEESRERARQYPYHMHINIDMLEAIILLASVVLNVSNLSHSRTKKSLKYYKKALEGYKRNVFNGPPENTRERIIFASKKLFNGEWRACQEALEDLEIWTEFDASLKEKLYALVQKESLKSFLYTSGKYYDSLSIDLLADRFQLDRDTVYSTIAKVIFTQKLPASLDQVNDCVILRSQKLSKTHVLAQRYVERLNAL